MKNINSFLMIGIVSVGLFISCNNTDEYVSDIQEVKIIEEDNLIEKDIKNISSFDASILAKKFANNEYGRDSRNASSIIIKDIQTITSESDEPLMYVVNYSDDQGFVVISATKNYTPVLAYSDKGYLDVNNTSFTNNIFMDEYKTYINSVINIDSDSLRQKYAIDWSFYEKTPESVESRAYTDAQIQQQLANARTYYSNQGYEVHSLSAATSLIPAAGGQTAEDRANGFINDICSRTPPQYDCMDVTLLLVKRTNDEHGPYLETAWHQGTPYAVYTPYGTAGCMKIAVTQLMYYYRWPEDYIWDNIRVDWGEYVDELTLEEANFMKEIGTQLGQIYVSPGKTTISLSNMRTTFENNDYNISELAYNRSNAMNYIKSGIPLIMYGRKDSQYVHVWICDGYKHPKVQYATYMIDCDFGEYTFFPGMTDDTGEYFHMNMGTGLNMWYYQDNATYYGDNYSIDRKMYPAIPDRSN